MKILVVNDQTSLREAIKELLRTAYPDVTIDEAGDGNQALQLYAERGPYDVVLTDIEHLSPNGIELAESIRKHSPQQQIGLITGYPVRSDFFGGVLRMVFDSSALIKFVDKLRSEPPTVPDTCFSPEFMRLWDRFMGTN